MALLYENKGPIAIMTLNRPEAHNATSPALYDSEDYEEGWRAFAEKRPPTFQGR